MAQTSHLPHVASVLTWGHLAIGYHRKILGLFSLVLGLERLVFSSDVTTDNFLGYRRELGK
jgi:hypothetical protein